MLDAERSVLREHHERLRALAEAQHTASLRAIALDDAIRRQHDARRQTRGMRDRMRARELDRRLVTADARSIAAAAATAAEAALLRVRATERRLEEVRGLVDTQAGEHRAEVDAARRTADLPGSARLFPTIAAFIADDPARVVGDPRQQDFVGDPLGERWLLEESDRPWIVTPWRVLWDRQGRGEVVAVEHSIRPRAARRVWALGTVMADGEQAARVAAAIGRQQERNSLAALAALVAAG